MKNLFIETYGCQMNVADSELVASVMKMAGYETCEKIEDANAVFLNTCSVRDNAEQKIFNRLEALHAMQRGGHKFIIGVLGCMAEHVKEDLIENHHVDLVAGPDAYLTLPDLIAQAENGEKAINIELSTTETYKDVIPERVCTSHISGFVSIMRGCNNFCHYCIVPYTRGRERSREVESILNEVKDLEKRGYKEVTLLGQNVNSYKAPLQLPPSGEEKDAADDNTANSLCLKTADPTLYGMLKEHSRNMRNNPTEAESLLWNELKGDMLGIRFRHQHVIDCFIADFVCLRKKLVIEIDGGYHNDKEQQEYDKMRSKALKTLGFRELRFSNEEVFNSMDTVMERIKAAITSPEGGGREGAIDFPKLLRMVARTAPGMRVRFTTSHPKDMSDETLRVIAEEPNVCKHIHLPVQSGSDRILKLMNRKYTRQWYMDRVEAIKRIVPDCGISTDIFCGYHSETEEDHQMSLSLMDEVHYDSAFMFKYSERKGTYASKHLPDDVPEDVKIRRLNELIALQNKMSAENNKKEIGKIREVLIEGVSKRSREQLFGRTEQNKVVVFDRKDKHVGEFVKVKILDSSSATLKGELVEE